MGLWGELNELIGSGWWAVRYDVESWLGREPARPTCPSQEQTCSQHVGAYTTPSLLLNLLLFIFMAGDLEKGCNISFMSQVICRVPIPLFPKSFKIVLHTFLLMHDYLKVISRNFHNSPLRYRLQLSSSSRFRHWDNRQFTDEHSNGSIKSQTYAILPLSWFRESRKLTCVTILIPPLGRDWPFLISLFPQEPPLYPLAHSLGLTTMVPVPRPRFPWKTLSYLP